MKNFLSTLSHVLPEEADDFSVMKKRLNSSEYFAALQPSWLIDFTPFKRLMKAGMLQKAMDEGKELVWLISADAFGDYDSFSLKKMVMDFYQNDEEPDFSGSGEESLELEEMLLLHCDQLMNHFDLSLYGNVNAIYMLLSVSGKLDLNVFIFSASPEKVWRVWTAAAHCKTGWLIDSKRGLRGSFFDTELSNCFENFSQKELLPDYCYSDEHMDETFLEFHEEIDSGKSFRLYLCPWVAGDAKERRFTESIIEEVRTEEQNLMNNRAVFMQFKHDLSIEPPLKELRELFASLRDQIVKDGGVSDFKNIRSMPFYDEFKGKSERFYRRVELFSVVIALYLYEDKAEAKAAAYDYMDSMVQYHFERYNQSLIFSNAYIFSDAGRDLNAFISAVYDDVKLFSCHPSFAKYIAGHQQNSFEETLLIEAYKRQDMGFAHWLIENDFYGDLQPGLFYIVYTYDKDKADSLVKSLTPRCIARILSDCAQESQVYREQYLRSYCDDPKTLQAWIFKMISKETACKIKDHLTKQDKKAWIVYSELMKTYFSE